MKADKIKKMVSKIIIEYEDGEDTIALAVEWDMPSPLTRGNVLSGFRGIHEATIDYFEYQVLENE